MSMKSRSIQDRVKYIKYGARTRLFFAPQTADEGRAFLCSFAYAAHEFVIWLKV